MTHPADNLLSRRRFGALAASGLAATALPTVLPGSAAASGRRDCYEPTWPSVDRHEAAPEWFQDAKFGIYWHWGAFTTPQYGSEWYGRDMYRPGSRENTHHKAKYGDPTVWGYDRFINGGFDTAGRVGKDGQGVRRTLRRPGRRAPRRFGERPPAGPAETCSPRPSGDRA